MKYKLTVTSLMFQKLCESDAKENVFADYCKCLNNNPADSLEKWATVTSGCKDELLRIGFIKRTTEPMVNEVWEINGNYFLVTAKGEGVYNVWDFSNKTMIVNTSFTSEGWKRAHGINDVHCFLSGMPF